MFAHALPQGSLRPAEALPPTLTPNAIFAMAPPAPRAMSFLGACLVYGACGAALMFAPAVKTQLQPPPTVTVILPDPTTDVMAPTTVRIVPPTPAPGLVVKNAPERPKDWTPPVASDVVPLITPTSLPTQNLMMTSTRAETPADALRHALPPSQTTGTGTGSGSAATVVEFDFQQMRILHQVAPVYPAMARLARIQGDVVLLMAVDPRGVPTEVKALSGPHPSLEQEAMRVARLWRFEPATLNGQAVSAQFRLTLLFRLK